MQRIFFFVDIFVKSAVPNSEAVEAWKALQAEIWKNIYYLKSDDSNLRLSNSNVDIAQKLLFEDQLSRKILFTYFESSLTTEILINHIGLLD